MLSTRNLILFEDVPIEWVFIHYCSLKEELVTQTVTINSIFSEEDTTPSMKIYYYLYKDGSGGEYKFKDFSSGNSGSYIDLVRLLFNLPDYKSTTTKILSDYIRYLSDNNLKSSVYKNGVCRETRVVSKYKVLEFSKRRWNTDDVKFWTQFNIGSTLLEEYEVYPLSSYSMGRDSIEFTINNSRYIYGYFKRDGTLYKIYQPYNKKQKFIIVNRYLQGLEQLKGHKNLCIISSMKDILACKSLNINVDFIAPNSENTILDRTLVLDFISRYTYVSTMLDNDLAGINAMKKYKSEFSIKPLLLNLSKDPSDSIRDFGANRVLSRIVPLFNSLSLSLCNEEESFR